MMIPLHLIPAQSRPALEVSGDVGQGMALVELPDLGLPIAGPVSAEQLQAFQELMRRESLPLQPTRMLYDRLYAFERLAAAHASGCTLLRELALQLAQRYQSAGEWIGLLH
ncbi:MAG TPA: hypothetical protein VJN44_10050 [Roseateles sp.]|nr:hypothetical protein [Roseateles sp.]